MFLNLACGMNHCIPLQSNICIKQRRSFPSLVSVLKPGFSSKPFPNGSYFLLGLQGKERIKAAATDMRYFAKSKLSRSLLQKKNFNLIWQAVFKLRYLFCQGMQDTSFEFK